MSFYRDRVTGTAEILDNQNFRKWIGDMIYIFLIVFCTSIAYIDTNYKIIGMRGKKSNFAKIVIIALCSLVAGMRGMSVGADTGGTYLDIYQIAQENFYLIRDKGYAALNLIAYHLFHQYNGVLFLSALITYALAFWRIFQSSKTPWYSVFLFFSTDFFFISMNMVRQSIVVAIFIFILPYTHSEEPLKKLAYFWLVCIGATIHTTGLILLPFYFVFRYIKVTPKRACVITVINFMLCKKMIKIIIKILFLSQYFRSKFGWYFSSIYNSGEIGIFGVLMQVAIVLFACVFYNDNRSAEYNDVMLCALIAGNLAIYAGGIPLIGRIAYYFSAQEMVYIPCIFASIKNNKNRDIMKITVMICYTAYMLITIYIQGQENVLPYIMMSFK